MRNALLTLTLLGAACAATQEPAEPMTSPVMAEGCLKAIREANRISGDPDKQNDEVQRAIDEVVRACNVTRDPRNDVIRLLVEDMADRVRSKQPSNPPSETIPSCEEMLEDFNRVPTVCGIPRIDVLIEKCGIKWRASYSNWAMEGMGQWASQNFQEGLPGEGLQTGCSGISQGSALKHQKIEIFRRDKKYGRLRPVKGWEVDERGFAHRNSYYQEDSNDPYSRWSPFSHGIDECSPKSLEKLFRNNPLCVVNFPY